MLDAVERNRARSHLSGNGEVSRAVEKILSTFLLGRTTLLTPSGTHALELISRLLTLREGDEVILPSFTFSSTALAISNFGAAPVFAEISPDTLNIDLASVKSLVTERTKAIVTINFGGEGFGLKEL